MSIAFIRRIIEGLSFHLPNDTSAVFRSAVGITDGDSSIPFHEFAATTPSSSLETPQQPQMTAVTLIVLALIELFIILVFILLSSYQDSFITLFYSQYQAEELASFLSSMGLPKGDDPEKRKKVVESVLVHEMFHQRPKIEKQQKQQTDAGQLKQNVEVGNNDSIKRADVMLCRVCDDSLKESCPICLADYAEGDDISHTHNCIHCFHADCVTQWLMNHDTCPCCRTNAFSCQTDQTNQELEDIRNNITTEERSTGPSNGTAIVATTATMSEREQDEWRVDMDLSAAAPTNNERHSMLRRVFGIPIGTANRGAITISRQSSFVIPPSTTEDDHGGGGIFAAGIAAAFDSTFFFY
uniref:RING-type domain-containing protein n=2 Tax=Ditylum brightwellii TaxID=49249 RepID=A0A6V2JPD1_9STRA|mmetsp:Transcript_14313/g.19086  ORF Transcript_14313/g.19086 Transcript_14313/m.19086 type:complete len:354 (+) Transcript_14313:114-1175(+)